MPASAPDRLRAMLAEDRLLSMPACFDALSAKLIEQEGFDITFMSGFAVSATRLASPDTGLMSYGEVVEQALSICAAVDIPVIGDGDTGYGNALNVRRTVDGFARAGCAAVMIEDQLAPKRCGHTPGKEVVSREEAFDRVRAAIDQRNEGQDILILARTDARQTYGLSEAIARAAKFRELGADILFVEAPKSVEEMRTICSEVPGIHMANMVEGGETPDLPDDEIYDIGYRIAVYPLSLLSASMKAMTDMLAALRGKDHAARNGALMDFTELRRRTGFDRYYEQADRYASARRNQDG
ncbi:MAG: oxaloacetate decarboxylase [Flavobacteriaceae bacterium]